MPRHGAAYDVVIVGGGISGCSLLYVLSRYRLRVLLLEKTNDVGVASTKANSAILHAGYDPEPGTRMAEYNVRGNALSKEICRRLNVLMREVGSLVVGFGEADRPRVEALHRRGLAAGVPGLRLVQRDELRAMEPNLAPAALCALYAPGAAVVNPWELAFAQAETAVKNGAEVWLDTEVTGIQKGEDGGFALRAVCRGPRSYDAPVSGDAGARFPQTVEVEARFVVNAAGVAAGAVAALAGDGGIAIRPSRGQYYLLDKSQGDMAWHVIFQCPTPLGKGILVAPTVHGNLIVGPNSEAASSAATTARGLAYVKKMAQKSVPGLSFQDSIRNFAGLRANEDGGDFVVGESACVPGLYHIAGIKSPGLTAAAAIAQDVAGRLFAAGLPQKEKAGYDDTRRVDRFSHMNEKQKAAAIAENPLYGRIVCRCESVTEGEVLQALARPLPPRSLDAVKRRVGPGMGRCQGGFCGPRVQAIIARELGVAQGQVPQDRTGMEIVTGRTKG